MVPTRAAAGRAGETTIPWGGRSIALVDNGGTFRNWGGRFLCGEVMRKEGGGSWGRRLSRYGQGIVGLSIALAPLPVTAEDPVSNIGLFVPIELELLNVRTTLELSGRSQVDAGSPQTVSVFSTTESSFDAAGIEIAGSGTVDSSVTLLGVTVNGTLEATLLPAGQFDFTAFPPDELGRIFLRNDSNPDLEVPTPFFLDGATEVTFLADVLIRVPELGTAATPLIFFSGSGSSIRMSSIQSAFLGTLMMLPAQVQLFVSGDVLTAELVLKQRAEVTNGFIGITSSSGVGGRQVFLTKEGPAVTSLTKNIEGFFQVLAPGADTDADGIPDAADNCPFQPNNGVADSQRDSDRDGRGDACECGNVNRDSTLDIFDALMIAQATLDPPLVAMTHPRACDSDGSGTCDIFDALQVARATLTPPLIEIVQECDAATVLPEIQLAQASTETAQW